MRLLYSRRAVALGAVLAALRTGSAAAQTTPAPDTTRLHYEEEMTRPPLADAPLLVQRQERGQWKLGLNNFIVNGYPFSQTSLVPAYFSRYGLHLAYERRLGRAWSGQAELSPALTHYRPDGSPDPIAAGVQLRAQLAGRYYYNLERRLRLGRSTGGFSANYFALALGLGVGAGPSETPFHLLKNGRGPATDAALLYGLQRRLGRYGFADVNVGLSAALRAGKVQEVRPAASLRVGLALPALGSDAPLVAPADEVSSLLPRFFAGLQLGDARYRTHYSYFNPFPATYQQTTPTLEKRVNYLNGPHFDGVATGQHLYDNDRTLYLYGGSYLRPRLALQLGVQYGQTTTTRDLGVTAIRKAGDDWHYIDNRRVDERLLAVPVQVRYALTRSFRRRLQVEAVGGAALVYSSVRFREFQTAGYDVTDEVVYEFRREALGVTANLGGALSYGLDRRRRLQLTVDYGVLQDLHNLFDAPEPVATSAKVGVRYRFGYR